MKRKGEMNIKELFGFAVKARRHELGISQEQLAEKAEMHRTYIASIERGARNVSLENIYRLAKALDTSIPALFESITGK